MSWILFSILAALIWAVVGTIDKLILTKWVRKPIVPVMVLGAIGLVASIFVYFIHGFSALSYLNIMWALVAGIFYAIAIILYFKSVKIEEISRVIPLWYLAPLFVSILAAIFLGEIFTLEKYSGVFLLVAGAILVSSKKLTKISLGKAFWFMILASLALSVNEVITKHLLNFANFWTIFSYVRIGAFFTMIPIFYFNFKDLKAAVKEKGKKVVFVMSLSEILNLVGVLLITIAISIGYVTLATALTSIEPFFVLLFTIALSIFLPKILKEEIRKAVVLQKLIAIALMFVGVVLVV